GGVGVEGGRRNVLLMRLSGLVSHRRRRTFMGNGSGVSRGDRNRNARLARLRVLVPATNAIVGIDLADKKQMVVVTDHDSKVLARKTSRCWVRRWTVPLLRCSAAGGGRQPPYAQSGSTRPRMGRTALGEGRTSCRQGMDGFWYDPRPPSS